MSEYSKDRNHKINALYGICWDPARTLRGKKVGNCWRVYEIASGRDEYAKYSSAEQAAAAADQLAAAQAEKVAAAKIQEAIAGPAPARPAARKLRLVSPAEEAHRIGRSYGVNGQIWDNA
ncbi:hypothetical protein MYK68_15805 [Gordonia sp. PP30]|uniref:hypothetical protein n=1 Tax=Gordonia sp. PP30 TaxID=2935861 RepID=UPI001FFFA6E5|nr:hypothetical protein [Gordonia sp. PP30]UQE74177.1 hypothetical protein MYK68_15805 [Gordonia sp. PP30]